ncbi:hypothetical protein [Pseudoalteromonas fuliginea]|uniref:hypothetical protein n=1 Tax=Pseudoalteromonas fuliginea TaxID=1872678 RepID=UPI00317B6AE4
MKYVCASSRLRSVFLGSESSLFESEFHVKCPNCKSQIYFFFNEVHAIKEELLDFAKASNLIIETEYSVEVREDLPAYVVNTKCGVCHINTHIIVGIKEVQPQRFNAYIKSVITET